MNKIIGKIKYLFILSLILVVSFLIYSPGLSGDYVFDDVANIVENKKIELTSLDYSSLKSAFWSGDAGPLGRPFSMLSFALNYYFTGFNPYYFKLTNLIIHLVNGLIIFTISLKLFRLLSLRYKKISLRSVPYLAALVCMIWLVHPLNLTSVLYTVQRMTSLSTLFGLLAILTYCILRINKNSWITILFFIFLGIFSLIASILSKESGVLFIILIYWIELIIFQGKNQSNKSIYIKGVKLDYILWFGVMIGFCLFVYILPPYLNPMNFARREFTLVERLLTESRVIFYYLKMFFYPLLSDLSLYHDDFLISKSIINPLTTLYSLIALIGISAICIFFSKKHPVILFAWGWYLISQLLESTFISLELVHEHRNYFGVIGFIIMFVYYIAQIYNKKIKPFLFLFLAVFIINLVLTTWQRAVVWSNLFDHAVYEAAMHPKSDRANYQLARIYMKLMQTYPEQQVYYAELAEKALVQSKQSYMPGNGAWFAELHLNSYLNQPIAQQTIEELIFRLKQKTFQNNNISFLSSFTNCQIEGFCKIPHEQAILIITAGLENQGVTDNLKAEIFKLLAQYFVSVISDFEKGEEFLQQAVILHDDVNGRLLFAQIYRLQEKISDAEEQLYKARLLDTGNIWSKEIEIEQRNIKNIQIEGE